MSFGRDLGVFAREVLQNSLDARLRDRADPVLVRFVLGELRDDEKQRFLRAAGFEGLVPHLEAVGSRSALVAESLRRARSAREPLRFLAVHDYAALGLAGPERGEGRFAMFARHKLLSDKEGTDAGGSFGLGKSVLWAASGWSTLFVRSFPKRTDGYDADDRFLGVAQLPYHETPTDEGRTRPWDGPGWFGVEEDEGDGPFSASFPPERARAAALGLDRDPALGTGTSIVLPEFLGFEDEDAEGIARALEAAAAEYFWPALARDPPWLRVEIDGAGTRRVVEPGRDARVRVFLHLAGLRIDRDLEEATRRTDEPLHLPATRRARPREGDDFLPHAKKKVPRAFRVAAVDLGGEERGTESEDEESPIARLALLRGSGMVVTYVPLPGERPVAAVAQAGTARGETSDDRLVEQFLRMAEPPQHNDWTADAPHLQERYKSGYKGELRGLKRRLAEAVRRLLQDPDEKRPSREVPRALLRVLRFRGRSPGDVHPAGAFRYRVEACRRDPGADPPAWVFRGGLEDSHDGPFQVVVEVGIAGEGGERLEVMHWALDGVDVEPLGGGRFLVPRSGRFAFEGRAAWRDGRVWAEGNGTALLGLAAVSIRLRRAGVAEGEGSGS